MTDSVAPYGRPCPCSYREEEIGEASDDGGSPHVADESGVWKYRSKVWKLEAKDGGFEAVGLRGIGVGGVS